MKGTRTLKYSLFFLNAKSNILPRFLTLAWRFYIKMEIKGKLSTWEAWRCPNLVLITTIGEIPQNPQELISNAMFVLTKRAQKPNYHIIARSKPAN